MIKKLLRKLRSLFKRGKSTAGTARAKLYINGKEVAHSNDSSYNFTNSIEPIKIPHKMVDLPKEFQEVLDKNFWDLLA